MANASGGVVAVGIEDSGAITGISDAQENVLRQVPFDFLKKVPELEVETITSEYGTKVFLFHISPMPDDVIKCKDGEAYLRVADSSRKLNTEQLLELASRASVHTVLEQRLRGRGTDSEEVIARRLANSKKELELWREYKYIIVNDDLNTASEALSGLIKSFRLSSARLKEPPFDEY